MKKVLLIISAFILSISNVKAETTDYQKEGEYLRKNLEDSRYQYEDENDVKYGPYSNYILYEENTPLDIPYYDYEIDEVYAYHKLYNIKTIQFQTVSGPFSYQNLKVYDDETKVSYTIEECSQCRDNNSYNSYTINVYSRRTCYHHTLPNCFYIISQLCRCQERNKSTDKNCKTYC